MIIKPPRKNFCFCEHSKRSHANSGWMRCSKCGCGRFVDKQLTRVEADLWWELREYRSEAKYLRQFRAENFQIKRENDALGIKTAALVKEKNQWESCGRVSVSLLLGYLKSHGHPLSGMSCNLCETAIQTLELMGFKLLEKNLEANYADKRIYD